MKIKKIFNFIIYVFGPLICGFIISLLFNTESYKVVNKPPLSPPSIVFPIVWSILYLLMGISIYIINKDNYNKKATNTFIIQLIINYVWPFLFFSLDLYLISSIWLVNLIYFVVIMFKEFLAIKKVSAYLQIPYLIWLIIALYLNIGVTILN